MKILATALLALSIVALPASYAAAQDYHHRHHGPVVVQHHRSDHGWNRDYRGENHHRWDRHHHNKPHFSHN